MTVETDLVELRQEVKGLTYLTHKIDETLDKVTSVANNIGQILAVQEQRVNTIERRMDDKESDLSEIRKELQTDMKELGFSMAEMEKRLTAAIQVSVGENTSKFKEQEEWVEAKFSSQSERIAALERWRWFIAGIAATAGFILNKIPFFSKLLS